MREGGQPSLGNYITWSARPAEKSKVSFKKSPRRVWPHIGWGRTLWWLAFLTSSWTMICPKMSLDKTTLWSDPELWVSQNPIWHLMMLQFINKPLKFTFTIRQKPTSTECSLSYTSKNCSYWIRGAGMAKKLANAKQLLVSRVLGTYIPALLLKLQHTVLRYTSSYSSRPAVSRSLSPAAAGLLPIHCSTPPCPPIWTSNVYPKSLNIGKTFFSKRSKQFYPMKNQD